MNHRQRLEACISGKTVDRPPVALWRHFPVDDQDPAALAKSILDFQSSYDFDFIKITPSSSFCVSDYGVMDAWRGNPEGTRDYISFPVVKPSDWRNLQSLSPINGRLGNQLECIKKVIAERNVNTPVIQTIFNPMSQAKNLVGRETLLAHMRQSPDDLKAGLEMLTENTIRFIEECIAIGIDGVFFAIQHAQASLLSRAEVDEFLLPFDEQVCKSAATLWLNVMHLHGKDIYFDMIPKQNFSVVNWHDLETAPSLPDAKTKFTGAVCGGMKQWETLVFGTPAAVIKEANLAIESTNRERFILGTGCVLPVIAPRSNIAAARMAVEK